MEDKIRKIWDSLPENGMPEESLAAFERFRNTEGVTLVHGPRRIHVLFRVLRNIAAVLLIPVAILSAILLCRPVPSDTEWCEFAVACGQRDSIILPDNSCVWLNAGSRLIYPKSFDGMTSRKVFLSGEAFFDVAKDPDLSFVAVAGDVKVNVHGTQFNVTSYEDMGSVSVNLVEGSVSLDISHEGVDRNILMVPGDVARYDKSTGNIEQRRIPSDEYLLWRKGGFYFNNQPLGEITAQFERVFGVEIHIPDKRVAAIPYTIAFVNGESLGTMLGAIAGKELTVRDEGSLIRIIKR